jgi:hypothetical protein
MTSGVIDSFAVGESRGVGLGAVPDASSPLGDSHLLKVTTEPGQRIAPNIEMTVAQLFVGSDSFNASGGVAATTSVRSVTELDPTIFFSGSAAAAVVVGGRGGVENETCHCFGSAFACSTGLPASAESSRFSFAGSLPRA